MKFSKIYNSLDRYPEAGELFSVPILTRSSIESFDQPLAFFCNYKNTHHQPLNDVFDVNCWNNLKTYKDSIFIYENYFEPTDCVNLPKELNDIIIKYSIRPDQFYVIVADKIQEQYLKKELKKHNLSAIHTDYMTKCLMATRLPDIKDVSPTAKFSLMSRRFVTDRLLLMCELINNNLLEDFSYSFHNSNPYTKQTIGIKFEELPTEYQTDKVREWIAHMPYYVDNQYDDYMEQFNDKMYNTILQSDIHIVVETIFHETIYGYELDNIVPWITEKTFKAIACKKIFLCYGMAGTLKTLHQMGFQTFGSIIDESYDSILDPEQRRKSLVREIRRISTLSPAEISNMIHQAKYIVKHNYEIFQGKKNKLWNQDFINLGVFK